MKYLRLICLLYVCLADVAFGQAGSAFWQSQPSKLADIRHEIELLNGDLVGLKQELLRSDQLQVAQVALSALERLNAVEWQLTRLTAQSEGLELRINRIVADGTNRIGDLEFRLTELEGGDPSQLGDPQPLGGAATSGAGSALGATQPENWITPVLPTVEPELAISEQADFDVAVEALTAADYQRAADMFATFVLSYPGSVLSQEAQYLRGQAYENFGQTSKAARAYLEAFSGQPNGPKAADALLKLGLSLNELGQKADACVTLQEVIVRFPSVSSAEEARAAVGLLQCL
ncbi:MAG: tol-pal system protein YbgF [Paracoccaceae bacterium]|jgi:tol-pal system protein YbgF